MKSLNKNIKSRKSQSEVITTVLLILIGIAAVGILSAFIINMVRTNLKGTECFSGMGQLEINLDSGWTYYYTSGVNKYVYINIERGTKDFNLTGIDIVYGTGVETKKVVIEEGKTTSGVVYVTGVNAGGGIISQSNIVLPLPGESKTYRINNSLSGDITQVGIAPIINHVQCSVADEEEITTKI